MRKILPLLFFALWPLDILAQAGCSDAGICTIGGHSTDVLLPDNRLSVRVSSTLSGNASYSYLEFLPSITYDAGPVATEVSINYRFSNATYPLKELTPHSSIPPIGKRPPQIQHVTRETNTIERHYAPGDIRLTVSVPLSVIGKGIVAQVAYSTPLTSLYEDRPQDMQSTLGLPAAIFALGFDAGDSSFVYGGTLGYYTTFDKQNSLHLTRSDDLAAALRASWDIRYFNAGVDISMIYHVNDDKLHGISTSNIEGYESTKGLTINIGLSANRQMGSNGSVGIYAVTPVVGIAHVDGLKRSYVAGVIGTLNF